MSKTFNNAGGNRDITLIDDTHDHFMLRVRDHITARSISVSFDADQAPALSLAILEAAGYTEDDAEGTTGLTHFALAMSNLRAGIEEQKRATAEAEAQAKLESEALELENAGREASGAPLVESMSDLTASGRKVMLAVARKARELNKETPNA